MSATTTPAGKTSAMDGVNKVLVTIGRSVGGVVGTLYQAGRDSIDTIIRNILPFMAFIAVLIGIINETGIGDWLAHLIEPLASNLVGLNLSEKLLPTVEDRARYGFTASAPGKIADLRDNLIVAAKALKLGVTSTIIIGFGNDDPHALFTAAGEGTVNAATFGIAYGNMLNAFMDDLMSAKDPFAPEYLLGDNTVVAFRWANTEAGAGSVRSSAGT